MSSYSYVAEIYPPCFGMVEAHAYIDAALRSVPDCARDATCLMPLFCSSNCIAVVVELLGSRSVCGLSRR